MVETLIVSLGERSYPIFIGAGVRSLLPEYLRGKTPLMVTDSETARHCLPLLDRRSDAPTEQGEARSVGFGAAAPTKRIFTLPAGESSKSFSHLHTLLDWCLQQKPDRHTPLVALGGGVVGDMTGFAASILLRGVPFIQMPTTLLAMVDSSVGGKTGINTAQGKNLVGSFYQPRAVLIDTDFLTTLPQREIRAGFAEVVKYGCIQDSDFFTFLEREGMNNLPTAIAASCHAKAAIVGQDEREESGQRALLNFGHTFGHALEAECGYDGTLLHGEAVSIGMVMAAELSARLGLCPANDAARIVALLKKCGLPTTPRDIRPDWNPTALMARMWQDKKVENGALRLILLRRLGKAFVSTEATETQLRQLWDSFCR